MEKVKFEQLKELDFRSKEAYNTLRTNIGFCGSDIHSIAFTSSVPNEGKSLVSFQCARALAEDDKHVLYIDADIRKSVMLARYGVDHEVKGLTHFLAGKAKIDDVICETNVPNLKVIFTGQAAPNPSGLLGSEVFGQLIMHASKVFDYVIVDCPPLGSVIDAAIVARVCDGTIIVIESDNVSYRIVQKVKNQLEKSGSRILGAVLNKVEADNAGYEYGRYYDKYYEKEEEATKES